MLKQVNIYPIRTFLTFKPSSKVKVLQKITSTLDRKLKAIPVPTRFLHGLVPPPKRHITAVSAYSTNNKMARLTSYLKTLTTSEDRLAGAEALMSYVYGPFDTTKHTMETWQPRPYHENKSRYLWTDSFGVVNFISLANATGKTHYLDQADALIKNVHNTLGRHRPDSIPSLSTSSGGVNTSKSVTPHHPPRLSGATDEHPTRGGLRIGKEHKEGGDADGQYYHYITKWAFALNRMSLARNDPKYNDWAVELLEAVHPHFVYRPGSSSGSGFGGAVAGVPRMFWKISIDMKHPMVPSEGNLDPFDGLVTVRLVKNTAAAFASGRGAQGQESEVLVKEEEDFVAMVEAKYRRYTSSDPLDLGEALWLSHWAVSDSTDSTTSAAAAAGEKMKKEEAWARFVATQSLQGLEKLWKIGYFSEPAGYRLAFREFGTTLGVQVNPAANTKWRKERVDALHTFWASRILERDMDITPVMMAASLVPGAWDKKFEFKEM